MFTKHKGDTAPLNIPLMIFIGMVSVGVLFYNSINMVIFLVIILVCVIILTVFELWNRKRNSIDDKPTEIEK